jgi:hypothetical protein
MSDKIEDKRGLQFCYWRTNNKLETVPKGGCYPLYLKDTNEFVLDERCVGAKTTNPKHTIDNARWAFIYDVFFQSLEKAQPGNITDNLWGPLSGGKIPVGKYALGTKYKVGKSILFNSTGDTYYYGFKQRVELFSESPGTGFYFYIIPVTSPKIDYAYFHQSEDIKRYGQSVNLTIMFHGYNLDKKNKYKAKVYLLEENEAKGLTKTKDFEEKNLWDKVFVQDLSTRESDSNWNTYFRHNFNINIDWKKGENRKKNFTVAVEVYQVYTEAGLIYGTNKKEERVDFKNYADHPTTDLINYDTKLLKIQDIDKKDSISSRFIVSEELMDSYLTRIEAQKVNQVQYIGDVRYTHKEFDPCGFSTITVKSDDTEVVIFNEDATDKPIDNTAQTFDIIAGDNRKNISIKVGKLTTKGVLCNGLLLAPGQKHSEQKNLFQIERVMPALRLSNGIFVTRPDMSQKDDYDVQPDTQRGVSKDVSETQEWQLNRDYKFNGDDEAVLMLRYVYNKTFLEKAQSIVSTQANEKLNTLWVFNYFILDEAKSQSYYLPVSTCRYPNQLVKVRVFPDMEWELAALIAIPGTRKVTLKFTSTRQDLRGYHNRFNFRYVNRQLEAKAETEEKVGVDFTLKAATSGTEFEVGYKIEHAIKKVVGTFNAVYRGLEVFDGRGANARGSAAVRTGAIQTFEFNIDPPNVGVAIKWKHALAKLDKNKGKVGTRIEGGVALKPFVGIGITVDLVAILGKVGGLVGKAVQWIIEALEYAIDNLDIYFNFKLNAEIAGEVSIGYHNLDGWDAGLKRELKIKVNASLEAGVDYEGTVIATVTGAALPVGTTEETVATFKAKASIGGGVEYTENWDADKGGIFKTVQVKFTGMKAEIEVYSALVRRKKTVHDPEWKDVSEKKLDVKAKKEFVLLSESIWYGPEKIYTDQDDKKAAKK